MTVQATTTVGAMNTQTQCFRSIGKNRPSTQSNKNTPIRTNVRLRKLSSIIGIKPRSKKGKSLKNTKARKGSKKGR
jgi:hypothetical protein